MIFEPKVLIVDDTPKNIQVVANILKDENYSLSFASSGIRAIELCKKNSFDLILLDVMMPEIDGFETCEKIKSISEYKDVPIIFLTARSDSESVLRGFEVGGVDYVTKPFNTKELLSRVKTQLKVRTLSIELLQSEKMALLGSLVAGVAHEINTPIGVCVTATSTLNSRIDELLNHPLFKNLSEDEREYFETHIVELNRLTLSNLAKASELIKSFKKVAVDQSHEEIREIKLCEYLSEVVKTLTPQYKKQNHKFELNCKDEIKINSYAGAIGQILTNLVINSIIHGFENQKDKLMKLTVREVEKIVEMIYEDNGVGIKKEYQKMIFEPFFTTKKEVGSGLGMNITQNLVIQKLKGSISLDDISEGVKFIIKFPKDLI